MTSPSPAIADTSLLSALSRIGHLGLLPLRFPDVLLPEAVWEELKAGNDPGVLAEIEAGCAAGWLRIDGSVDPSWQAPLSRLGPGESAVLALAAHHAGAVVLMDEKRGRRAARMLEFQTTGVLGLLAWAKQAGHIPSLAQAIHDLRTIDRFFIDPSLVRQLLDAAGEPNEPL